MRGMFDPPTPAPTAGATNNGGENYKRIQEYRDISINNYNKMKIIHGKSIY